MNDLMLIPEDSEEKSPLDMIVESSRDHSHDYLAQYEAAKVRYENISSQLPKISVREALEKWLSNLSFHTAKTYREGFKRFEELQLVMLDCNLKQFSMFNHEIVLDSIKNYALWSEATRQARAAAYSAFTGFLERQTSGIIRKAVSKKTGVNKTFFKIRDKVKTPAMSEIQTKRFLRQLEKMNQKYALLAKVMLQGGKRTNEVLSLPIKNIDFLNKQITFIQSKTSGRIKKTVINYPGRIMRELRRYIGKRNGDDFVFISKSGRKLSIAYLGQIFKKAGKIAKVPFNVTPHVLRVTLVTRLKELRVHNADIMKITGHSSVKQLEEYDKSDLGENATRQYFFV